MLQVTHSQNSAFDATFKADHFAPASSPADVRELAAKLVASDRLQDAVELIQTAFQEYPDSEDLLVTHILLSEIQNHWSEAAKALEKLVTLQGTQTTLETWRHWVRVLRCEGDHYRAHQVTLRALKHHARDPLLLSELSALESILGPQVRKIAA
ncbi:hypothetical protein B9Z45_07860 [Limnohabitans sp. 2KL-17]|uniref:hypothetical protein n=1 Tax=Limnohabitans sp. 2KL-17 TaxID=1100704 RepID=UPI000D37D45A|nr:hypothetical protein [Limnohabitans sp. 2KL-17]PUE57995.1 hypothetical protein B9Z45_07860 [Limnohabitans sp. 2KL-17]